jgi:hypothetical protein
MRLLFDRDLTPHPQYAAFYNFLATEFDADALVHFGMHGTVEWLPGSPLGNSGFSWSDVLLSSMPNVYVYAANNPSESIIAKRRGYGTIVSHTVPPYGRAGALLHSPALVVAHRHSQRSVHRHTGADYAFQSSASYHRPRSVLLTAYNVRCTTMYTSADGVRHCLRVVDRAAESAVLVQAVSQSDVPPTPSARHSELQQHSCATFRPVQAACRASGAAAGVPRRSCEQHGSERAYRRRPSALGPAEGLPVHCSRRFGSFANSSAVAR